MQSNFLKTGVFSTSLNSLWKGPSVINWLMILVSMVRYESQSCLRILDGIAHSAFLDLG